LDCSDLVVITELDVVRVAVFEPETNAPLVIDGNGMLTSAVSLERVQPIARRNTEVGDADRDVHSFELSQGTARHIRWQALGLPRTEQRLGLPVGEGLDHPKV
jgi:hypothetical protein